MSNLTVTERNGVLVVDSRLIAQHLGIEHHTLLKTINKYLARLETKSPVRFEVDVVKRPQGGGSSTRYACLDERQATLLMTYSRNTKQVLDCKDALVDAFEKAKLVIKEVLPEQNQVLERMRLELELLRTKQRYQDTGYAIQLSTSPAVLRWLRGETPPPKEVVYKDRFLDATGKEIGSSSGRSLTQLIVDAGLNPKSTKDRQLIKKILKYHGLDYDRMQGWATASYLREYPVLEDQVYEQALKAVLGEVIAAESQPNLFVHSLQQAALSSHTQPQNIQGVIEP